MVIKKMFLVLILTLKSANIAFAEKSLICEKHDGRQPRIEKILSEMAAFGRGPFVDLPTLHCKISSAHMPGRLIKRMARRTNSAEVDIVSGEQKFSPFAVPNDLSGSQWALSNAGKPITLTGKFSSDGLRYAPLQFAPSGGIDIKAPAAWDIKSESNSIVAVLDSGVDLTHPDLKANLFTNRHEIASNKIDDDGNGVRDDVNGYDFVNHTRVMTDIDGHGTAVAGVIGAKGNNGIGISGTAFRVTILPVKVVEKDSGMLLTLLEGLDYVNKLKDLGQPIKVINISLGSTTPNRCPAGLANAMEAARIRGILVVSAAGNESANMDASRSTSWPSNCVNAAHMSVANLGFDGNLDADSNYGATLVDLAAPGEFIYTTYPAGLEPAPILVPLSNGKEVAVAQAVPKGYAFLSGTSLSSPIVAAAAALVAEKYPKLSAAEIRSRIVSTVTPIRSLKGKIRSGGLLNMAAALR